VVVTTDIAKDKLVNFAELGHWVLGMEVAVIDKIMNILGMS
jgi:hypothetical protein